MSAIAVVAAVHPALGADMLPLKHGIFVESQIGCADVSNATAMSFWGTELNTQRTIGTIVDVSKDGNVFSVRLEVSEMTEDATEMKVTLTISGPEEFTIESEFGVQSFRWCFEQMPV